MKSPEDYSLPEKQRATLRAMDFAYEHLAAMRALFSPATKLLERNSTTKNQDWRNVIGHSWNAALAGSIVMRAMNLPEATRERIENFLVLHDARQRLERGKGFTSEEREDAQAQLTPLLAEYDPDTSLMTATHEEYAAVFETGSASLEQMIVHYIDNCCMEDGFTSPEWRLDEVRARRPDITASRGEIFWERELEMSRQEAVIICEHVRLNGYEVSPMRLPSFIIGLLQEEIGQTPSGVADWPDEADGTEILSGSFKASILLSTPRSDPTKNEDRIYCKVKGPKAKIAIFDGATMIGEMPESLRVSGEAPGARAARIAKEAVAARRGNGQDGIDATPVEDLIAANGALRADAKLLGMSDEEIATLFCSTGTSIQLEKRRDGMIQLEYAYVGNSPFGICHENGQITWLGLDAEDEALEVLEIETARLEAKEQGVPLVQVLQQLERFPETKRVLEQNRQAQNNPDGHGSGALTGGSDQNLEPYIRSGQLILRPEQCQSIIALSDGAFPPVSMPQTERTEFVRKALANGGVRGLQKARKALAQQLRANDCSNPPCLKPEDDFSAVEVRIF